MHILVNLLNGRETTLRYPWVVVHSRNFGRVYVILSGLTTSRHHVTSLWDWTGMLQKQDLPIN